MNTSTNSESWLHGYNSGLAVGRGEAEDAIKSANESGLVIGLFVGSMIVTIAVVIFMAVTR